MSCCGGIGFRLQEIQAWFQDYDNLLRVSVHLIYAQVACSLIGSLGPLYNGALLVNLANSLFALVAIESSSQKLARAYALLLFCCIFLDIAWFVLFSRDTWVFPNELYGSFFSYLVKLTLTMQIIGFSLRLWSSFLWIQMYRLGAARINNTDIRDADFDVRNSFLNPGTPIVSENLSRSKDEILGGSTYYAAHYMPSEDGVNGPYMHLTNEKHSSSAAHSPSAANTRLNSHQDTSLYIKDLSLS